MSPRPQWERCAHCRRYVTFDLLLKGLGRQWREVVPLGDGDEFTRTRYEHTFPCKGRSLQLRDMLAEYAALLRERDGRPPEGYVREARKRRARRPCKGEHTPRPTPSVVCDARGTWHVAYCVCGMFLSMELVTPPLPDGEPFVLDDNSDDRPDDPGYAADAWKRV